MTGEDTCLIACRNCVDVIKMRTLGGSELTVRFIQSACSPTKKRPRRKRSCRHESPDHFRCLGVLLLRLQRQGAQKGGCRRYVRQSFLRTLRQLWASNCSCASRLCSLDDSPQAGMQERSGECPSHSDLISIVSCCLTSFVSAIETLVSIGAGTARPSMFAGGLGEDFTERGAR